MRIAIRNHLYPPLGIGGAERSVQFLAEALVERGHDVLVISTGTSPFLQREVISGVHVVRMGSTPGFAPDIYDHQSSLRRVLRKSLKRWQPDYPPIILKELREFRPDVVHSNTGGEMVKLWKTLRELDYATVHTLRNPNLLCARRMFAEGRSCEKQCADCAIATRKRFEATKYLRAVVGISDFILQRHLTHGYFPGVPIRRVIPNSYDPGSYTWKPRPDGAPLRLGYLGRLHPTKGVAELIQEMQHFPGEARLLVGGTGNPDYVRRLKSIAGTNVDFLGFVESRSFLERVDALVVPSTWNEPFGRVYAEAACHGVPVVGSVLGAGSELVEQGRNGWLCDPTSSISLRTTLRLCLNALNKHGSDHFRQICLRGAARFSISAVAAQYEEVYEAARSPLAPTPHAQSTRDLTPDL